MDYNANYEKKIRQSDLTKVMDYGHHRLVSGGWYLNLYKHLAFMHLHILINF